MSVASITHICKIKRICRKTLCAYKPLESSITIYIRAYLFRRYKLGTHSFFEEALFDSFCPRDKLECESRESHHWLDDIVLEADLFLYKLCVVQCNGSWYSVVLLLSSCPIAVVEIS
jgi:hypothetical protein